MQEVIRLAISADFAAIRDIDRQTVGVRTDRSGQIVQAIEELRCHVHVSDSKVVGFAISTPQSFRTMDFLELLVVDSSHRRKGIAASLLTHFIESSTTPACWTSTNSSNSAMLALLKKLGWIEADYREELDPGDPDLYFFRNTGKISA